MDNLNKENVIKLFELYMKVTDVPRLGPSEIGEEKLRDKKLGIINGSSWITLWSNYFGSKILPEVKLVNVGNEGVQLNFMEAHEKGLTTPPEININKFSSYARDLVELVEVDAILISCSTMNRSYPEVEKAVKSEEIPVVPIDLPMMEKAVKRGGRVLVIATHGPTVESTRKLLEETAERMNKKIKISGATVEKAFDLLGKGKIKEHNQLITDAIQEAKKKEEINTVVLAQLSMTVFKLSYPDAENKFGAKVLTSGEEGFKRVREILLDSE